MKYEFTNEQLSDISFAILIYMSHIEKTSKIDYEQNPLIKKYLKIYNYIENLRKKYDNRTKDKSSKSKDS